jgi:hypothetical protein
MCSTPSPCRLPLQGFALGARRLGPHGDRVHLPHDAHFEPREHQPLRVEHGPMHGHRRLQEVPVSLRSDAQHRRSSLSGPPTSPVQTGYEPIEGTGSKDNKRHAGHRPRRPRRRSACGSRIRRAAACLGVSSAAAPPASPSRREASLQCPLLVHQLDLLRLDFDACGCAGQSRRSAAGGHRGRARNSSTDACSRLDFGLTRVAEIPVPTEFENRFFFIFHGFTLRVSFKRCSQLDLRRTGQAINRPRRSEGQVHETELFRDRDGR